MNEKGASAARVRGSPIPAGPTAAQGASRLFESAVALHRQNRLDEAGAQYRTYLRAAPRDPHAWTNLGALLRSRGLYGPSIAAHRRALQIDPGLESARRNLSNALHDDGRFEEAARLRREILTAAPDAPDRLSSRLIVEAALPVAAATDRIECPAARMTAISSLSSRERWR